MPSKSLLIGLDGAEPDLLFKWASAGLLPNLKSILADWHHKPIDTPNGFGDGVFWASLVTGVGVGKHGRYFPLQYNPVTYQLSTFSLDEDMGRDPFWYYCSKAGAKVAAIDIYSSPIRTGLNGIQIMDWMIHDRKDQPRSWPNSLIDTIQQRYMPDPLHGSTDVAERTEGQWCDLHRKILARITAKTSATEDLLRGNEWDIFSVGFCDPHDIGHQSWHWHDTGSQNHPTDYVNKYGNPVLQTYQALDQSIKGIVEASQASHVYLVAGLGMDRQSSCNSVIQQVLGHYCGRQGSRKQLTDLRIKMPYFELPHNMNSAAIRINLIGRDAQGIVANEDYDDTCKELSKKLLRLTDAETNECIVEDIVRVHQQYPGKFASNLPDLLVIWKKPLTTKTVRVDASTTFDLEHTFNTEFRSGDHTNRALFISNTKYQGETIRTEAIAPTICRSIGINLPETDADALAAIKQAS